MILTPPTLTKNAAKLRDYHLMFFTVTALMVFYGSCDVTTATLLCCCWPPTARTIKGPNMLQFPDWQDQQFLF